MYLVDWKETLPAGKVHVPLRLKETFQASKDVPCWPLKGRVSKDTRQRLRMLLSPEKEAGYPDAPGPDLGGITIRSKYKIRIL
jgi:hypothetical protein